jgi:hypothetical protein
MTDGNKDTFYFQIRLGAGDEILQSGGAHLTSFIR